MGARIRGVVVVSLVLVTGAVLGTWIAQWIQTPASAPVVVTVPVPVVFGERVRVEVRNGGGQSGMARTATDALRDHGFDVVEVGNWENFQEPSSFIVNRNGATLEDARRMADLLGIQDVRSDSTENLFVDVTVVLGQEWGPESIQVAPQQSETDLPWWDPRRYLRRPGTPEQGTRLVDPETDTGWP